MRILHVIRSANPEGGGPIEAVRQMAIVHRGFGHSVEVASFDCPTKRWVRDFPGRLHAMGPGFGSYGYAGKARKWFKQHARDYDVAVLNGLWQYCGICTWRAFKKEGRPYVVFPHGMLDPWFKRAYPFKHLKKAAYWRVVESRVVRDALSVMFTCEEERRRAQKTFSPYYCQEDVVPLGVSVPVGDPTAEREAFLTRFPQMRGKRFMLFLGRVHEKKGCDLLIGAFAGLEKMLKPTGKIPPGDVHLVIAGPCPIPSYRDKLNELLYAEVPRSVYSQVTWTGMLSGAEKWGAFRAADAFVLPSHQENFGISVVEALSCGLPVLISDKVNIWREIVGGNAGFAETDDFRGTSRLIRRWIELPDANKVRMRLAARACFEEHFDVEQVGKRMIAVLAGRGVNRAESVPSM